MIRLTGRQLILYGLVLLLIGILIGSVSLTYPFGRDQGIYAYAGKLLLEGKMNYQYVFDLKPPGIHFLFAFAQSILGESMYSIRWFDILWQTLTAFVVFLISFRLNRNTLLSLVAGFLTLFLYYRQDYWHTLQADGSLNLPFAISVLLLISSNENHSFIKIFFAGVMLALAMLFKYTIISFLPLVLLIMLFNKNDIRSIKIKNVIYYSAGIIMTGLAVVLIYSLTGALDALINLQLVQTPLYTKIAYETESTEFIVSHIIRLFTTSVYGPLVLLSFGGFIYSAIKKKLSFNSLLILSWVISSLFSLIFQWKFYNYHFLVIIPAISIGAVYTIGIIWEWSKEKYRNLAVAGLVIFFAAYAAFAFKPYVVNYHTLLNYLTGKITLKEAYIFNGTTSDRVFMMEKTYNAVDAVEEYSNPGDYIYVWGFDPLVYYLSGRKCTSRFIYSFPLFWKGENKQLRAEFMEEVNKNTPRLILVADNDPLYFISGYNEYSKQLLERFPEFKSILSTKYSYKKKVDDYDLYELKSW